MPVLNPQGLLQERIIAVRGYHEAANVPRAELDVSGGVDSAVMLGLLAHALGPERITAVYQGIRSSEASLLRAREAAAVFGVALVEVDLTSLVDRLVDAMVEGLATAGFDRSAIEARMRAEPTVLGSIRSCVRAPVGRGFNRLTGGGIRHGTGNECEDRWLRFYQKGGDGEVDTNPIAMLSKGEVYQLGRTLGVPRSILTALPTPDLWGQGEQHSDEQELQDWLGVPFTYSRVDPDTGAYTQVGTIERVSRFADTHDLFGAAELDPAWALPGVSLADSAAFLAAARRVERLTRHKANPNCPALGSRASLVSAGLLTNELPLA